MSLGPGTLQGLCVMCKAFLPQRPPNIAWHETALWLRHKSYLRFHKTSVTFGFTWEANSCLLDESSVRDPPVNPILHPSLLLCKLCCANALIVSFWPRSVCIGGIHMLCSSSRRQNLHFASVWDVPKRYLTPWEWDRTHRNTAMQHGELCGREPAPCVDKRLVLSRVGQPT